MKHRLLFTASILANLISASNPASAQDNKYGLHPINTLKAYQQAVAADPRQALVPLKIFIPRIRLDIRYATDSNIMHHPMYARKEAFLRRPAAEALKAVEEELIPLGYGIKVFDGYRPYHVTVLFYEAYHDSNFVASPYTGSRHNRGCAVDVTLVDLHTGKDIAMPTPFDSFSPQAASNYSQLPPEIIRHRKLLQDLMIKHGFALLASEWWHFDYTGWKDYPITDLSFEQLSSR